ncbi:flavin reductase [Micrococcoides hystricis]|uniref:Flavin reductase n=1 Tax=Micrococcoides hystricis TaxID=1572761 RepID=A0ABV6PA53_9MICC
MQHNIVTQIQEAWSAAWDQGNFSNFDKLVAPDYSREGANSEQEMSYEDLKQEIRIIREAFPDLKTSIEKILVDADSVAVFWKSSGTFSKPLNDVPPTGRRVETAGTNLMTIQDGMIVKEKVTWDAGELLADLGVNSLRAAFELDQQDTGTQSDDSRFYDHVRSFNRQFVTGVTVVTTLDGDVPRGLAVNSYASVSFDPPLVIVCVQKSSSTYPSMFKSDHIGINILATDQSDVLASFASKSKNKFEGVDWEHGPKGSPLLSQAAAALEVEVVERVQVKTHTLFIGKVTHANSTDKTPIVYKAGKFYDGGRLEPLPEFAD